MTINTEPVRRIARNRFKSHCDESNTECIPKICAFKFFTVSVLDAFSTSSCIEFQYPEFLVSFNYFDFTQKYAPILNN